MKAIFLLREQIVHRKLYLPSLGDDWLHLLVLAAKNGRISYAGGERKKKGGAVHIKRCVVKNECEISHVSDDENGCCFAMWRGNRNLMCDVQRGRGDVLWGWEMQGFIINYTVDLSVNLRLAISLHVLQLCKDQEDLFLLAVCPSPETEKPTKEKGLLGCVVA